VTTGATEDHGVTMLHHPEEGDRPEAPLRFRPVSLCVDMLGCPTTIVVSIHASWDTSISIRIGDRRPRLFRITSWHPMGMKTFCFVFHWHSTRRDEKTFGCVRELNGKAHPIMDEIQIGAVLLRAVQDIVTCVNTVFRQYGREMRSYASWYLGQACEDPVTYSDVITQTACRLIVDCNLTAPDVRWNVVEFGQQETRAPACACITNDVTSMISDWHISTAGNQPSS
jgi:hypothetical protein